MSPFLHRLAKRIGLYECIAFVTGFVLMAYELAASRILAPTIGTSIYVWTSVIGVMIAALAAGYAAGGWVADRRGVKQDTAWLLLAAAFGIMLTCVFYIPVLTTTVMVVHDPRIQGVIASALLFAPASFTMGMISPYLAKLRVNSLRTTGRSVATLSALNSLGGITGTFSAGFIFFNYIGSRETLALLAVVVLACSWVVMARYRVRVRVLLSTIICILLAMQFIGVAGAGLAANIDTPTSHYRIADIMHDGRQLRVLTMGPGGYQSGVYVAGNKDLAFPYARKIADIVDAAPHKDRILILGGGAFTLPEYLGRQYPQSRIDVVEIDPKLSAIAASYFRYAPTDNIHTVAQDARTYLGQHKGEYDVAIIDVYNDTSVPFALATQEYTASLKQALKPAGVVAANIIAAANVRCMPLLGSINNSYTTSFRNARLYPATDVSMYAKQNIIGVYSNRPLAWANSLDGEGIVPIGVGQRLTDNFAPTEHLIQQCM